MKRCILSRLILPVMLVTLIGGCATASGVRKSAAGNEAVITGINIRNNSLAISSNKHFTYTIYSTNDPYKITVEIPDMSVGSFTRKIESDKAGFTEVIPRQTAGPNRAVKIGVLLQSPTPVEPSYTDNTLTIKVKSEEPVTAQKTASAKAEDVSAADGSAAKEAPGGSPAVGKKASDLSQSPVTTAKVSGSEAQGGNDAGKITKDGSTQRRATEITGVRLEEADGALKVVIEGNGTMVPNVFPLKKRIVIDVPDVTMKAALPKSVISPLRGIRAGRHKNKIRLVLDLMSKTRFEVAAVGDAIEVSLEKKGPAAGPAEAAAKPAEAAPAASTPKPSPEPAAEATVTHAAQKTEPAEVESAGQMMPSAEVGGSPAEGNYTGKKISLDFQNAEIGPIFRLLADVNGYNLVLDPSVHGKTTIKLMNVPWDQALNIILNNTTPALSYKLQGNILWIAPVSKFDALARDTEKMRKTEESVAPLKQEIIRINYATASQIQTAIIGGKLLSPRGSITVDNRMNTLIIKDTQQSIDKIKDLVKIMDVAKPQVMIEAKIVQVSNDYNETLGINWGGSFTTHTFPNVADGTFSVNAPVVAPSLSDNAPGGTLGMTVGHANTAQIALSLQALETVGKAKILSNPKILTMDNEAAMIQQGKTFFIPTTSQAGTQTQSEQATLSLKVTPKIAPDGFVQLKVNATDNSLEPGTAGAQAVVDTKSLKTQALVGNGQTLVLGGIYTSTETESENRVPLLGKIPVIGWLFKTTSKVGPSVSELLIFITPRVINRSM